MLSDTAEYALRSVLYIATHDGDGRVTSSAVARELDLPANYLSKTLRRLAKRGVLDSSRGPGGGYALADPPGEVALADVVAPFQPLEGRKQCLMGQEACSEREPCPAHDRWRSLTREVESFFRETTLADLVGSTPPVG